jgi:mannose-6-phosphate isomerase-like protein (cupin superfamily)
MSVVMGKGCRVNALLEGTPETHGSLRAFPHFGRATGATAISLRVLECAPGRTPSLGNVACDEVLYVLDGAGTLIVGETPHAIERDMGVYVPPGVPFRVEIPGPNALTLVSSRCPDPETALAAEPLASPPARKAPAPVRLLDRPAETTADRWYRVLVDAELGSAEVTQFVGSIPPGRAPDHFHEYEEILCILAGEGRMWAGRESTPIGPGSCVFLPRRQVHCVENTGTGELRLLGVFYPAGSPAVRYDA